MSGKIELFQQTEYDPVDFEINLQGVQGGNDYYVYSVSCYFFFSFKQLSIFMILHLFFNICEK